MDKKRLCGRKSRGLTLEFLLVREMAEEEAESVARMYFTWWKRRHARELASKEKQEDNRSIPPPRPDFVV